MNRLVLAVAAAVLLTGADAPVGLDNIAERVSAVCDKGGHPRDGEYCRALFNYAAEDICRQLKTLRDQFGDKCGKEVSAVLRSHQMKML